MIYYNNKDKAVKAQVGERFVNGVVDGMEETIDGIPYARPAVDGLRRIDKRLNKFYEPLDELVAPANKVIYDAIGNAYDAITGKPVDKYAGIYGGGNPRARMAADLKLAEAKAAAAPNRSEYFDNMYTPSAFGIEGRQGDMSVDPNAVVDPAVADGSSIFGNMYNPSAFGIKGGRQGAAPVVATGPATSQPPKPNLANFGDQQAIIDSYESANDAAIIPTIIKEADAASTNGTGTNVTTVPTNPDSKSNGASKTDPEVLVEGSGASTTTGGDKPKKEKVVIADTDTSEYSTKGLDPAIAKKILESDYSKTIKAEMLDVARWQTRHKPSGTYVGEIDGMWGKQTQSAYDKLKSKKDKETVAITPEVTKEITSDPIKNVEEPVIDFQDNFDDEDRWTKSDARVYKRLQRKAHREARQEMPSGIERRTDRRDDRARRKEEFRDFNSFEKGGILYPKFQTGGPLIKETSPLDQGFNLPVDTPVNTPEITNRRKTKNVQDLQRRLGVTADGIWGPKSQAKYDRYMNGPNSPEFHENLRALGTSAGIRNTPKQMPVQVAPRQMDQGFNLPVDTPEIEARRKAELAGPSRGIMYR
jgi:hypothetical protein